MSASPRFLLALAVVGLGASSAMSAELSVGDPVPALQALDDAGQPWKSTDVLGERGLVLFFYPAAMTGG